MNEQKNYWRIFLERYKKNAPTAKNYADKVAKKAEEIWKNTGINLMEGSELKIWVDKNGKIMASDLAWALLGAIPETIIEGLEEQLEKISKEMLSLYIPEIQKLIKCPQCSKWNRHDADVCRFCGTPLHDMDDEEDI